jgi:hypothetical protein
VLFWSFINGIDPAVTKAVIAVESTGNPFAVNKNMDIGLMQIRAMYVPESKQQLLQSCTNVMVGTRILGRLKEKCKLCLDKTYVNWYNLGITGGKKLKRPLKFRYYKKIVAVMERK